LKKLIERFNSINSLKVNLESEISDTQFSINELSNLLGEKIRTNEELAKDDPDFLALKEKLGGTLDKNDNKTKSKNEEIPEEKPEDESSDDQQSTNENKSKESKEKDRDVKKKVEKKKKSKKGASDKWYDLNEISIYNGMGLKGELELYFKAVDELKGNLENLQRCLATLNNVIEKGLKADMGCVVFRGSEGIIEIAFLKSEGFRQNFSLKARYSGSAIPVENMIKIGV